MNHITWSRHQQHNKRTRFDFLIEKSFYKTILPPILIILFYILTIIFSIQNSLVYKSNLFSEEKWFELFNKLNQNKENTMKLMSSIEIENESFKTYKLENNTDNKTLILFHGSRIDPEKHMKIVTNLAKLNYNIIIPFIRGYGPSRGQINEFNTMIDMRCLYECLKPDIENKYVVAQSHGCAVALYFDKISGYKTKKIVLENPFYNLKTVIKSLSWQSFFRGMVVDKWESDLRIMQYKDNDCKKILIIYGEKDEFVKFKLNGEKLMLLKKGIKCKCIKGARHTNGYTKEEFYEYIKKFFAENKN